MRILKLESVKQVETTRSLADDPRLPPRADRVIGPGRPILILSIPGLYDRGRHPRDAIALSLKHMRQEYASHFHAIIVSCGPDLELAKMIELGVNGDWDTSASLAPPEWDQELLDLSVNPELRDCMKPSNLGTPDDADAILNRAFSEFVDLRSEIYDASEPLPVSDRSQEESSDAFEKFHEVQELAVQVQQNLAVRTNQIAMDKAVAMGLTDCSPTKSAPIKTIGQALLYGKA